MAIAIVTTTMMMMVVVLLFRVSLQAVRGEIL